MIDLRIGASRTCLLGLSVGDAFGAMLDAHPDLARRTAKRLVSPARPWRWTDDTAMAIAIVDELAEHATIDPDSLARRFAERFLRDPDRGYGAGAHRLLGRVAAGADWRTESRALFRGGSFGNGGAMRAAPIGAYFAGDLARVRDEAARSAEPTHAHVDGSAGAIGVAIAAALVRTGVSRDSLLERVLEFLPPGETRKWLGHASRIPLASDPREAGEALGTGSNATAQDTVPFALWVVARSPTYEDALWTAAGHTGVDGGIFATDRDTLGAIVGGILARSVDDVPLMWREATEPPM